MFRIGDRVQVVYESNSPYYSLFDVGTVVGVYSFGAVDVDFGPHHPHRTRNGDAVWTVVNSVLDFVPEAEDEP